MSANDAQTTECGETDLAVLGDENLLQFDLEQSVVKEDVDTFIARSTSFVLNAFTEQMRAASAAISEKQQLAQLLQSEREETRQLLERILVQLKSVKEVRGGEAKDDINKCAESIQSRLNKLCEEVGSFLIKMHKEKH